MPSDRIVIIGAGVSGLCLAHGLRQAGIPFALFERDAAPHARAQDRPVRISRQGQESLARCLPPDLLYLLFRSASRADPEIWRIDSRLQAPSVQQSPPPGAPDLCVNHRTLLEILGCGIAQHVRYGHALETCGEGDGAATAIFANGMTAEGALLIGADGADSAMRTRMAPDPEDRGGGLVRLQGHVPATPEMCRAVGRELCAGTSIVLSGGIRATIEVMAFHTSLPLLAGEIAPDCHLSPVADYFHWSLTLPADHQPVHDRAALAELIRDWAPALRRLILSGEEPLDPPQILQRPALATTTLRRIALIGDAARGCRGDQDAAPALRDAAELVARIVRHGDRGDVRAAVRDHAADLRERARDARLPAASDIGRPATILAA